MKIKLEKNKKEIQEILDFYANFWKQEYWLDSIMWEKAFDNERFKIFSIYIWENFIGSWIFEKMSDNQYEMRSIAIKKEYRWKWYWKELIEFMEKFAKEKNIKSIITLAINKVKWFYEKLWYKEIKPWNEKVEKVLKFLEKSWNPTAPMEKNIK